MDQTPLLELIFKSIAPFFIDPLVRLVKFLNMTSKSFEETDIAEAALAAALCAFIISLGQLLGQYFATAEGYRNCQPSVMGPWAKRTRLRWRWSQFRFETLFTAPRIFLTPFKVTQNQRRLAEKWIETEKNGAHIRYTRLTLS